MDIVEIARNNFNSWNRHDAEAIAAAYAEGGVYITPSVPGVGKQRSRERASLISSGIKFVWKKR